MSKIGTTRGGNLKAIQPYNRRMTSENDARTWEETPTAAARLAETWWLGLRLAEGISAHEARVRADFTDLVDPALPVAHSCVVDGLVEVVHDRYRLTARGLPLADYVAKRFLAAAT